MKKLLVILLSLGLAMGASAQRPKISGGVRGGGGVTYVRPRVTVIAPYYPYRYGMGYGYGYRYSPFYDPFYSPNVIQSRPSELDLQIDDIKNEYKFKISSVKHDKSLAKDARKQQVRDLKHQREDAIIDAKKSYYKAQDEKRNNEENE